MSGGPPSEGDSPFPSPGMDSVRSRDAPGHASPPTGSGKKSPLAIVAVVVLVAVGAVSAAAVALWDGGGENPSPPITTQPTTTDDAQPPR